MHTHVCVSGKILRAYWMNYLLEILQNLHWASYILNLVTSLIQFSQPNIFFRQYFKYHNILFSPAHSKSNAAVFISLIDVIWKLKVKVGGSMQRAFRISVINPSTTNALLIQRANNWFNWLVSIWRENGR